MRLLFLLLLLSACTTKTDPQTVWTNTIFHTTVTVRPNELGSAPIRYNHENIWSLWKYSDGRHELRRYITSDPTRVVVYKGDLYQFTDHECFVCDDEHSKFIIKSDTITCLVSNASGSTLYKKEVFY